MNLGIVKVYICLTSLIKYKIILQLKLDFKNAFMVYLTSL